MIKKLLALLFGGFTAVTFSYSQPWVADKGDGTYKNPILFADYSDPDVIRSGNDYYMVASSFNCMPGIPVLHSYDLVNWTIVNHIYTRLPYDKFNELQHGGGSWAPSIRYHNGLFYVYFCTPVEGLFVATARDPKGKWTLHQVAEVAQWEDPCPLWDDDGNAYLAHSKLCGGLAIVHRMSPDGLRLLDNGRVVYENQTENPTLEGLKLMKKDGWYYILAPAGGVATGWQTVLRSRSVYGPYESKKVLYQGETDINGPHQGGLVDTQTGEYWFLHFQDREAYGRIVHLQPAVWKNNWPVIGVDADGDGCGEPVASYTKPNVGKSWPVCVPQTSDEFDSPQLGKQWQWQAHEQKAWYSTSAQKGYLRLYAHLVAEEQGNLWYAENLLLQKFMAPEFTVTTKLTLQAAQEGERAGLVTMGEYWHSIALVKTQTGYKVGVYDGGFQVCGWTPGEKAAEEIFTPTVWLRASVTQDAVCSYSYSIDGTTFKSLGPQLKARQGRWIGAKTGVYCLSPNLHSPKRGWADVDFFRVGE